jgi:hypothetical protein
MFVWTLWGGATVAGGWALGALGAVVVASAGISGAAEVATVVGGMLAGAGVGAALGLKALKSLHRGGLSKGEAALDRLLRKLGVELKTGSAFEAPEKRGGLSGEA